MLIHNDAGSQEPLLYDCTLPACLKTKATAEQSWVMVLDSQMGTGAAALSPSLSLPPLRQPLRPRATMADQDTRSPLFFSSPSQWPSASCSTTTCPPRKSSSSRSS